MNQMGEQIPSAIGTGRINIFSGVRGVFSVNAAALEQINSLKGITLATIPSHTVVEPKKMVATIKTIGLAVPESTLTQVERIARETPNLIRVRELKPARVVVILTGSAEAQVTANIKSLLQVHVDAGADLMDVYVCMHPNTALHLSQLLTAGNIRAYPNLGVRGGEIWGVPVVTSVGAVCSGSPTEKVIAAINTSGAIVADGDLEISASNRALVQMDDATTQNAATGTATDEVVVSQGAPPAEPNDRALQRPFLRAGTPVPDLPTLDESREHARACLISIPWEGLKLSAGEPALTVQFRSHPPPGPPGNRSV